jgi:hypothetical protein
MSATWRRWLSSWRKTCDLDLARAGAAVSCRCGLSLSACRPCAARRSGRPDLAPGATAVYKKRILLKDHHSPLPTRGPGLTMKICLISNKGSRSPAATSTGGAPVGTVRSTQGS